MIRNARWRGAGDGDGDVENESQVEDTEHSDG